EWQGFHLHLTESSAFNDSNLLSGWLSYLRTDYRDSLINESHSNPSRLPLCSCVMRLCPTESKRA
ncbi:hypothetical protein LC608_28305, partial [Nostoc sp. XA010]|nr:hypothetical protein [Nostoc sp. XA010]